MTGVIILDLLAAPDQPDLVLAQLAVVRPDGELELGDYRLMTLARLARDRRPCWLYDRGALVPVTIVLEGGW